MADMILICPRDGQPQKDGPRRLRRVAARLAPDHLADRAPLIGESHGVHVGVVAPTAQGVVMEDGLVSLGGVFDASRRWAQPGSAVPDGTYAMARFDPHRVELLNDVCASRPLWWVVTDRVLLASTSQRAIAALLGDLRLNPAAPAWLLSSGTTGPETAWDERVHKLPPDARLVLERRNWQSRVDRRPATFRPARREVRSHVAALRDAIVTTCGELGLDLTQWRLPLSGGLDSRVILAGMVACGLSPRCITWTTRQSLHDPLSDAAVARRVARHFRVEHEYLILEPTEGGVEDALNRFVSVGEGCTEALAGYVDGGAMWRDLAAGGASGVIRGDESAGERKRDAHDEGARRGNGAVMVDDFEDSHVIRHLGLAAQEWPTWLHRLDGESREEYCDRLSQQLYVPMVLGPLNAVKARYLEVVNPLLSRRVIDVVRELPDDLRVYGRALHAVAGSACPWIPYARSSSVPDAGDSLTRSDYIALLVRELVSPAMARVLSEEGATLLLAAMAAPATPPGVRRRVFETLKAASVVLPARFYDRLAPRSDLPDELDARRLALRATLACRTIALLEADAASCRESRPATHEG
jgi:hypothetical protein